MRGDIFVRVGNVTVTTLPGEFHLLGVCPDGGPRLIDSTGSLSLIAVQTAQGLKIEYTIIEEGNTDLSIYDIYGTKVKTLETGYMTANSYSDNYNIRSLNSGLFFIILTTPNKPVVKKMIILK